MEMLILFSLMMVGLSQPMVMVMVLFLVTLIYSKEMYMSLCTMWYSLVMMLVMLSGILVIFTYMASMYPNEKFDMSFFPVLMIVILFNSGTKMDWVSNLSFMSLKLWEYGILVVNLVMVSYLLVIMLVTIWVSEWFYGAAQVN